MRSSHHINAVLGGSWRAAAYCHRNQVFLQWYFSSCCFLVKEVEQRSAGGRSRACCWSCRNVAGFASLSTSSTFTGGFIYTVYIYIFLYVIFLILGCIHIPCGLCLSENWYWCNDLYEVREDKCLPLEKSADRRNRITHQRHLTVEEVVFPWTETGQVASLYL